jgi:outer membrane protein OmpA-like peptidoglycan-associated protein
MKLDGADRSMASVSSANESLNMGQTTGAMATAGAASLFPAAVGAPDVRGQNLGEENGEISLRTNQPEQEEFANIIRAPRIVALLTNKQGLPPSVVQGTKSGLPHADFHIQFALDSAEIAPSAYEQLKEIAGALNAPELKFSMIGLEGHTDSTGSDEYNLNLSWRRAESVKRFMVERFGIPSVRMISVGLGENAPVETNETETGRQRNRRVTIVRLGKATSRTALAPPADTY